MRSDAVKDGVQKAPHRSLFRALGLTEEEMKRPLVGIVNSYNEIVPGHMNLDKITEAVKLGVAMAGGVPREFPAIAVCDGIAMGHQGMKYSLVTRDLIADSTEAMAMAHQFDALVMIPNCDKNVPGLLMAAARLNIPTIFVSGGPMLAGHLKGRKRSLSSMFEAVGEYTAGSMTEADVREYEEKVCPTCGSCSGMYTANSMNCLTEVLGMGLKGNGTIPAVYSERLRLAKMAGMQVMELWKNNIRPRPDIVLPQFHHLHACHLGQAQTLRIDGRNGSVALQAHAEHLGKAVHAVCRIHARAGTAGRTDLFLIFTDIRLCHGAGSVFSHRLKHAGEASLSSFQMACEHRASADKDGRDVQSGRCHQKAGNILVAVGDHDKRVELMRHGHGFRGVRDQVPGHKRVFHSLMAHGDSVTDRDRRKFPRYTACHGDSEFHCFRDLIKVHMSRNNFIIGVHNSHQRPFHFLFGQTQRAEQRTVRCFLHAVFYCITSHSLSPSSK